jgi:hypothetical protein
MTGGHVVYPLLISLANLLMDFWTKGTNHTFHLLTLLLIPKFVHRDCKICSILKNRLIHECLDFILALLKKTAEIGCMMSDPVGNLCYVFTLLTAYMVDVQEATALCSVAGKTSHITMAMYKQFGDDFRHPPRTPQIILSQIELAKRVVDPWNLEAFVLEVMKHQLNGVHEPFWHDWPLSDPSKFFMPEPLHHWHKMFWDHDAKWCIHTVGPAKIDFHFSILSPHSGLRHFSEGISKLKQVTG